MPVTNLVLYDAACRAIVDAKAVDEVKHIRDIHMAMATYARQAKNHDMEADAIEIRLRATRRIDQLRQARTLGAMTEEKFEEVVCDAREKVSRTVRHVVDQDTKAERRAERESELAANQRALPDKRYG